MSKFGYECDALARCSGDIVYLLGKLARKGAYLQICARSKKGSYWGEVYSPHNDFDMPIARLDASVVEEAVAAGLLKAAGETRRLHITPAGAKALRALRSEGVASVAGQRAIAIAQNDSPPATAAKPCRSRRSSKARYRSRVTGSETAEPSACQPKFDPAESPLGWLRRRKGKDGKPLISEMQYQAGERLREDFWTSQLTPNMTSNWSAIPLLRVKRRPAPGSALELSERVCAAQQRVRKALDAVGPELSGVLIDVCCHLKGLEVTEKEAGWPRRCGKVVLMLSLDALARHYRLAPEPNKGKGRRSQIRHWGAQNYRPTIDGMGKGEDDSVGKGEEDNNN